MDAMREFEPAGATFAVETPQLGPGERPIGNVKRLVVRLPVKVTDTRIAVLFTPAIAKELPAPKVNPLAEWKE